MNLDPDWVSRIKRTQAKNRNTLRDRLAQSASLSYWTTVENNLSHLMNHINTIGTEAAIPTRKKWRKMLYASACESYHLACGQETPRQMRAFAKGRQKLTAKNDKQNSGINENTMEVEG